MNKRTPIEEIYEHKAQLEQEILFLLTGFVNRSGLTVEGIEIDAIATQTMESIVGKETITAVRLIVRLP